MQDVTEQLKESEEAVEAFEPSAAARHWQVSGEDANGTVHTRNYVQEELGFFPKQEFVVIMTRFVDRFVSGDLGLSMKDLFSGDLRTKVAIPTTFSPEEAQSQIEQNTEMIRSVIKIVQQLPELQVEIILLSLGVPRNERDWAKDVITGPPSRGGIDDDTGFELLKVFITQNAKAIMDFFAEKGRDLVEHAQRELGLESDEEETTDQTETVEETSSDGTRGGTPSSTTAPSQDLTPPSSEPGPQAASS